MKALLRILVLMLLPIFAGAHTIDYQLDKPDGGAVFLKYLVLGYQHIIPFGLDHILFILCVFFLNTEIKKVILQATMFTIAHSITLALAMYGLIKPPPGLIEPIIAISIVFLAFENIVSDKVKPWRMVMVFLFGLVHGMGFAGALSELGLPQEAFATALAAFNIGVELGQLSIILLMYFAVSRLFSGRSWYRRCLVIPVSIVIALIAGYWTVERIFIS